MLGRENETKPLKWLKIENSETDEEDSALGSNISSASSEIGQHDYENTKKTVSSSANSITTSNMVKIEVLKAAKPVKIDFSSPASSEQYVVNSIKRYTRFRQREKKKTEVNNKDAPRKLRASVVPSSSSRSVSPTARLANLPNSRPQNKAQKQQQIFFISQSSAAFSTSNKSFSVADFNKIQEPKNKLELVQEWVQDQKTCSSISHRTESELDVDTQDLRMRSNLSKSTSDIAEASNYEEATLVFSRFPSSSGSNSASSRAASKSAALPNRAPKTGSSSGPASPDLNSCGSHSRKLKKNVSIPIDLRCPVCLDLYAKPLFLPCGHTFCKGCIKRVVDASEEQQKRLYQFFCPTCRNIIEYGEGGIDLLQKNMKMAQAITKYEFHGGIKRKVSSYQTEVTAAPLKSKPALEAKANELQNAITRIERSRAAIAAKKKDVITRIEKDCAQMIQLITKRKDKMVESAEKKFEKPEQKKADQLQVTKKALEEVKQDLKAFSPPSPAPTPSPAPVAPVVAPKKTVTSNQPRKNTSPSTKSASKFLQKLKSKVPLITV